MLQRVLRVQYRNHINVIRSFSTVSEQNVKFDVSNNTKQFRFYIDWCEQYSYCHIIESKEEECLFRHDNCVFDRYLSIFAAKY